jgi:hypothetical protein
MDGQCAEVGMITGKLPELGHLSFKFEIEVDIPVCCHVHPVRDIFLSHILQRMNSDVISYVN